MSTIKYRVLLPIVQFLVAAALLIAGGYSTPGKIVDFPYPPTPFMVCRAISAPAALFEILVSSLLPFDRLNHSPITVFGFQLADIVFLIGVVALWYIVGRFIDARLNDQTLTREPAWEAGLLAVAAVLVAAILLWLSIWPIIDRGSVLNLTGTILASILKILWSGFLLWSALVLMRKKTGGRRNVSQFFE